MQAQDHRTGEVAPGGGDPEEPKTDGELKVVKTLIQHRVPVDPVRLANEDIELSGSDPMLDCET